MSDTTAIDACLTNWHAHLRGQLPGGLDALLHDDCAFLSPIVFSPQRGKDLTKLYLGAAGNTLGGDDGSTDEGEVGVPFRYAKEIRDGHHAMLEFETSVRDHETGRPITVNGVDIITCDDDGMIVEFKVMIRPLQAIHHVHAQMKAMLEQMGS